MLEIPESNIISKQLSNMIVDKTIINVIANASPHGFAFYFGEPNAYNTLLSGEKVKEVSAHAGLIEISFGEIKLLFGDGANVRYMNLSSTLPKKHQLLVEFDDHTYMVCTIQMYGGIWAFKEGENQNPYYIVAKEKPSPLTDDFDWNYFEQLMNQSKSSLSLKAFLATEQRIPGLGNGVLQDLLFNAKLHPKRKLNTLSDYEKEVLFNTIKETLQEMIQKGGRDSEKDLFGEKGGYIRKLSSKTVNAPCQICGTPIIKQAYLGGSIYFCPKCQPL